MSPPIFPSVVALGWHNGKHPISSQEKRIKLGDGGQEETFTNSEYSSDIIVLSDNTPLNTLNCINSHWSIRMIEFYFDCQSPVYKGTTFLQKEKNKGTTVFLLQKEQQKGTTFFF